MAKRCDAPIWCAGAQEIIVIIRFAHNSLIFGMRRFESEQKKIIQTETKDSNGAFLKMETELMRRAGCLSGGNARCDEWISAYAEKLRSYVGTHPEVLDAWKTHPEDTMKKVEALFESEGGHRHDD